MKTSATSWLQVTALSLSFLALGTQGAESRHVLDGADSSKAEIVIPVTDLKRSRAFYESLGCSFVSGNDKSISMAGGGLRMRLSIAKGVQPSNYPILIWRFADAHDRSRELHALGLDPGRATDWPGGIAFFEQFDESHHLWGSTFKDPDGNALSLVNTK